MSYKNFYLTMSILGTFIPWVFFGSFFSFHGIDILFFLKSLFVNGAAAGFSSDVVIALLVFWVWSWQDMKVHRVANWWLVFPASFTVGLSLAFPLYLYMREKQSVQLT